VIYEVFPREREGAAMCSTQGRSPRRTSASPEVYAREQYGAEASRRRSGLVPRDAIEEIGDFVDEFDLKYRRVDGYSIKERLKEARQRAGTLEG
jgi:hypothetical protein